MISGIFPPIRRLLLACLICLTAASAVHAQNAGTELPDAPVPNPPPLARQDAAVFHGKIFWPLVAALAASAVADAQTSHNDELQYPNGSEYNSWLYGRRPSLGRYYATFAVMDGGGSFLSYKLLHSRHKPLRVAGWGVIAALIGSHAAGAILNSGLRPGGYRAMGVGVGNGRQTRQLGRAVFSSQPCQSCPSASPPASR